MARVTHDEAARPNSVAIMIFSALEREHEQSALAGSSRLRVDFTSRLCWPKRQSVYREPLEESGFC
jgi:hypothetical protein